MSTAATPEPSDFRSRARAWLRANVPATPRPDDGPAVRDFDLGWQRKQFEGGWAGIAWPRDVGGLGLTLLEQMIWHEEYALAAAPRVGSCFVGLNHAGPTLMACGTAEQKRRFLPPILRGEVIWCQGFSEPQAGSDLAAVRTAARIEGDELIVCGQKIWTSYAQHADLQELLVRTSSGAKPHEGITWVICDMHSPGITVRPIRCMNGTEHLCEVFYDDVRIPLNNVVGRVDDGWRVAMSTLSFERGTAFLSEQIELLEKIRQLTALARRLPDGLGPSVRFDNQLVQQRLCDLSCEIAALKSMATLTLLRTERSGAPGPAGSMMRLYVSQINQRLYALATEILGARALEFSGELRYWVERYLWFFSSTISGGTSEIQLDIIGERVLGLPRMR